MTNIMLRARIESGIEDVRRMYIQYKPRFLHTIRDQRIRRLSVKLLKDLAALSRRLDLPDVPDLTRPTKHRKPKLTKREVLAVAADFVASNAAPKVSARELLIEHAKGRNSDFDVLDKFMSPPGGTETVPPLKQDATEDATASNVPNNDQPKNGDKND